MKLLSKINIPLLFIITYLVKLMFVSPTMADAAVLFILSTPFGISKLSEKYDKYLEAKNAVLCENEFRNAVMRDIAGIKEDVSVVKLQNAGGLKNAFGKR